MKFASICCTALLTAAIALPSSAQQSSLPLVPTRPLSFTTSEGTWMSLDVSPDGRRIVFDLLGDLYVMPIEGGSATRLTEGQAFDSQPRFSPDGKTILFVSDRDGADNIWLIDANGQNPRMLTHTTGTVFIAPRWTPDGSAVVVSQTVDGTPAIGIRLFQLAGGSGVQLIGPVVGSGERGSFFLTGAFGPDKDQLYIAALRGAEAYDAKHPQIERLDMRTGKTRLMTGEHGSGFAPVVSPDGRYLVYGTRVDTKTALRIQDLNTEDERWLVNDVGHDMLQAYELRDPLPSAAFTPDSKAVIMAYGGKFHRIEIPTGTVSTIPFTAQVQQTIGPLVKFDQPIGDSIVRVRQIRHPRPSPDGKRLVFEALDRIWTADLGASTGALTPHCLTAATSGEFWPVWSPDGQWIAYVTWADTTGGAIYRMRANGEGSPERLTRDSAYYTKVNFAPDGKRVVAVRTARRWQMHTVRKLDILPKAPSDLVWLPASGGAATVIMPIGTRSIDEGGGWPHFGADTSRVQVLDAADGLVSVRFDGSDRRTVIRPSGTTPAISIAAYERAPDEFLVSPTGENAIGVIEGKLYLVTLPRYYPEPLPVSLTNFAGGPLPAKRITRALAEFAGWRNDGRAFYFARGPRYYEYDLAAAGVLSGSTVDSARAEAYQPKAVEIDLRVPADRPAGSIALRGARIITMRGDEVIENGDIVVTKDRIASVGARGQVSIPKDATVIDVKGATIIPGWVDGHGHIGPTDQVHRNGMWQSMANLAYGVTTTRDPQSFTYDIFTYRDLVETGAMVGPRILSTGPGHWSGDQISNLDDAREVLRRNSADELNAQTVKQYRTGDRKVRQWVYMASNDLKLNPTNESGMDFRWQLSMVMDGSAGIEHAIDAFPLYHDVLQLFSVAGTTHTPTLMVAGEGAIEDYFPEHYDLHSDAKYRRFTPHADVDEVSLQRKVWMREGDQAFPQRAAALREIVASGGRVGLGGHGNIPGIGAHFELWGIASGGMKNLDVLRVGTVFAADALGLSKNLGSLEAGKLADLQVLLKNPLENIRNTNTIKYVMKGGHLYDANTLDELWPRKKSLERQWWWASDVEPPTPR